MSDDQGARYIIEALIIGAIVGLMFIAALALVPNDRPGGEIARQWHQSEVGR